MWVSTMGEKSIKTTQLPDVQNVIVSKQYIGEVCLNHRMVQFGHQAEPRFNI